MHGQKGVRGLLDVEPLSHSGFAAQETRDPNGQVEKSDEDQSKLDPVLNGQSAWMKSKASFDKWPEEERTERREHRADMSFKVSNIP